MMIGKRLRVLREENELSQGDIEKRTGLLLCYISRVENGHTVPAIETLEKMARALKMPLYQLMCDGDEPPQVRNEKVGNEWGRVAGIKREMMDDRTRYETVKSRLRAMGQGTARQVHSAMEPSPYSVREVENTLDEMALAEQDEFEGAGEVYRWKKHYRFRLGKNLLRPR